MLEATHLCNNFSEDSDKYISYFFQIIVRRVLLSVSVCHGEQKSNTVKQHAPSY